MVIIVHLSLHHNHNPDGIIMTYSHLVELWEFAGNHHADDNPDDNHAKVGKGEGSSISVRVTVAPTFVRSILLNHHFHSIAINHHH